MIVYNKDPFGCFVSFTLTLLSMILAFFMDEMSFFTLPSMLRAVFMDETFKIDICVFCKPLILNVLAQMPAWRGRQAFRLKC